MSSEGHFPGFDRATGPRRVRARLLGGKIRWPSELLVGAPAGADATSDLHRVAR
jgi:hypothetical protein